MQPALSNGSLGGGVAGTGVKLLLLVSAGGCTGVSLLSAGVLSSLLAEVPSDAVAVAVVRTAEVERGGHGVESSPSCNTVLGAWVPRLRLVVLGGDAVKTSVVLI